MVQGYRLISAKPENFVRKLAKQLKIKNSVKKFENIPTAV